MSWIFPEQNRGFPGKRAIRQCLRAVHLAAMIPMLGGYLYAQPFENWQLWHHACLLSGLLLALIDFWSNGIWLLQLRGQIILFKIAVLWIWHPLPEPALWWTLAIVGLSSWIAHASGDRRYYSVWHRQRIDLLSDLNNGK